LVGQGLGDVLRTFEVEVLVCPKCGGRRLLLAAVTAPESIERVLRSMGLAAEALELAPARAPPGRDAEWCCVSGAKGLRQESWRGAVCGDGVKVRREDLGGRASGTAAPG
jgi:hypothetical protein